MLMQDLVLTDLISCLLFVLLYVFENAIYLLSQWPL